MIMTFDKYIKKRNYIIFFKLYSKFDVNMTAIDILKKFKSIAFTVKKSESIINVTKPNRRTTYAIKNPLLFKVAHKDVG